MLQAEAAAARQGTGAANGGALDSGRAERLWPASGLTRGILFTGTAADARVCMIPRSLEMQAWRRQGHEACSAS